MAVPASSIAFFTSNPLTMHTLGEPDCKICLAPFSHTAQQIPVYHTCTNGRLSIQKVDAFHVGCLKQAIQAKETATRREAELFGRPIDPTIGSECPICQLVFDKKQLPSEDQFTKDQIEANQKAVYKLIRETIQGNRTSTSQSLSDLLGFDITQLPSQDQFLHEQLSTNQEAVYEFIREAIRANPRVLYQNILRPLISQHFRSLKASIFKLISSLPSLAWKITKFVTPLLIINPIAECYFDFLHPNNFKTPHNMLLANQIMACASGVFIAGSILPKNKPLIPIILAGLQRASIAFIIHDAHRSTRKPAVFPEDYNDSWKARISDEFLQLVLITLVIGLLGLLSL